MKIQNLYLAGIAILLVGGIGIQVRKQSQSSQQQGQEQTVATILDQVEPLCRALLPTHKTLQFTASKQYAVSPAQGKRPMWAIDCMDGNRKHLMNLLWDEQGRHPVFLSRQETSDEKAGKAGKSINHQEALAVARKWASSLNIASINELTQCDHKMISNGDILFVRLYPSSGEVMIWINPRSGNILNTHIRASESAMEVAHAPERIATDSTNPPSA